VWHDGDGARSSGAESDEEADQAVVCADEPRSPAPGLLPMTVDDRSSSCA